MKSSRFKLSKRYFAQIIFILSSLIFLISCIATGTQTLGVGKTINAPRIIALNVNDGGPWMREIEKRLKQSGFRVLRTAGINEAIEVDGGRIIKYNEASTRYYLHIDALAPVNWAHRCFGDGWNFDYIHADLIDLSTNETISSMEGRGFSEKCPPMSGTIFFDINQMIVESWAS
tara:strand:- start:70 stop:591 length:522 start_codon:yes stop_codon:yes gene_type:complete